MGTHLPGMPCATATPSRVHTGLRCLQTSLPDVILLITHVGRLLSIYAVYRVAYTASCRMPPRDWLTTRHALPTVVHTGLRCGRHPAGCHAPGFFAVAYGGGAVPYQHDIRQGCLPYSNRACTRVAQGIPGRLLVYNRHPTGCGISGGGIHHSR